MDPTVIRFVTMLRRHPPPDLSPYTTLIRSHCVNRTVPTARIGREAAFVIQATGAGRASGSRGLLRLGRNDVKRVATSADRKSTRLNSSHVGIWYALLCLVKYLDPAPRSPDPQRDGPYSHPFRYHATPPPAS